MEPKIIFADTAVKEMWKSFQWYENRSAGLGWLFVEFVDKTIKLISINPEGYPKKRNSYREIYLSKFPFVIVYEFVNEKKVVYVLHIFHTKRNPKSKYRKK